MEDEVRERMDEDRKETLHHLISLKKWFSSLESMSSDAQNALKTIEEGYNVISAQIKELDEKKKTLETDLTTKKSKSQNLTQTIEDLRKKTQKDLADINNETERKKREIDTLKIEKQEIENKINGMKGRLGEIQAEYNIAKSEIEEAEAQLRELREQLSNISSIAKERIDSAELLRFFRTLIERVFEGGSHTRILIKLHDLHQPEYKRIELSEELGIGGAIVRHNVFELAKANLINYDEDTQKLSLKERLY
ncbi:MAG: hypothetical protein ACFFDI_00660 [Promethearchaeota archaeon]